MRFLATLFRNLSRHGAVERDLDEEVHAHFELLVDEYRATGMEDAAARRAARLELGGTEQVKDAVRDVRRGIWLEHFWHDLRYALRTFRRSPGFAATAVVSLAVGIAAATGVFSVVNAALLNPFPFADSDRIVWLDKPCAHSSLADSPASPAAVSCPARRFPRGRGAKALP